LLTVMEKLGLSIMAVAFIEVALGLWIVLPCSPCRPYHIDFLLWIGLGAVLMIIGLKVFGKR
jgi:hypothetical protein